MAETRLIDANALGIDAEKSFHDWPVIRGDIDRMINRQPTIDPESLRPTGRWILTNEDYEYLTCSVCGNAYYTGAETYSRAQDHLTYAGGYRYCPRCGAKMEGDGK